MRYIVKVWDVNCGLSTTFLADVDSPKKLKEIAYIEGEQLIESDPDVREWYWDRASELAANEHNEGETDEWWYYFAVNQGTDWKYHRIADDAPNPFKNAEDKVICISYDDFVNDYGVEEHEKRNIRAVRKI